MIDVGQTVGNYTITDKLCEGGMGVIFLAEHPVIGRKVALKAIHPQFARNAEVISRFVTEARVVNQIGHEHIVTITDFGHTPAGDFYFIMEYLQGEMLSDVIVRQGALPPARALHIAAQIADALAASHEHGVIHRDLKPDNVFLIARDATLDFVKVLDFGLAKLTLAGGGSATQNTGPGMIMGTPHYMSPEQCAGQKPVDHRADVYALGVILFEMLTGRVPFGGSRYGEVIHKHLTSRPPTARSLVPDLPPAIDAILSRALTKAPGERFQTMAEFRAALLDPESDSPARPMPVTDDDVSGRFRAALPAVDDAELMPKRSRRGMFLVGVAALAGVAVASGSIRQRLGEVLANTRARPFTVSANLTSPFLKTSDRPSDAKKAGQPAVAVAADVPSAASKTVRARDERPRHRARPGEVRRHYALGDDPDATLPPSAQ